eukprot:8659229-Karenia_brevis.AAC.1
MGKPKLMTTGMASMRCQGRIMEMGKRNKDDGRDVGEGSVFKKPSGDHEAFLKKPAVSSSATSSSS